MKKREYIFGTNALAHILMYFLQEYGHDVQGFVLNKKYVADNKVTACANPILGIEDEIEQYGSSNIAVYVATGYANMNNDRRAIFSWLEENKIDILSYIHPTACVASNVTIGKGNVILENTVIQPFSSIGKGNIIWNNVSLCHHSAMGSFNYISPSATIAGRVYIGNMSFLGANCTIKNDVCIGDMVLIGAGSYVNKSLNDTQVFLPAQGYILYDKTSSDIQLE